MDKSKEFLETLSKEFVKLLFAKDRNITIEYYPASKSIKYFASNKEVDYVGLFNSEKNDDISEIINAIQTQLQAISKSIVLHKGVTSIQFITFKKEKYKFNFHLGENYKPIMTPLD